MRLICLSLLVGCTHAQPVNRAGAIVHLIDKDAQCLELRRDSGPEIADSVLCGSHGTVIFVAVGATEIHTKTLVDPPKPEPPKETPATLKTSEHTGAATSTPPAPKGGE